MSRKPNYVESAGGELVEIDLPYQWRPRGYQARLWSALESGAQRSCVVWHRRAGKDLFSLNWTACASQLRVGLYWHLLPTYRQARKVVWEGMTGEGRRFLSAFGPGAPQPSDTNLVERMRDDEMTLWLKNGSMWQAIGAEDHDRLVGTNPVGVVFSEWSVMNPLVWEFLRPILVENGGWALFIYTPRGRNHGHKTFTSAQKPENQDEWFSELLTCMDTQALHKTDEDPKEEPRAIQAERAAGMPEELIQQEFYCSFDAPLVGSYFGDQVTAAVNDGRVTRVLWDPEYPVSTAWDLGMSDSTVIWFAQQVGSEVRLIDVYAASGVGMDHYAKVLSERPYTYKAHYVPHDATVRELAVGRSRLDSLRRLGIKATVVPKVSFDSRINAARMLFPRLMIDDKKCDTGIEALKQYRKQKLEGVQDPDGKPVFKDTPVHDWTSHYADALCYLAVGLRPDKRPPRERLAPRLAIV